jgi:hypothetical protein
LLLAIATGVPARGAADDVARASSIAVALPRDT